MVLEKPLESFLDSKEIKPVNPKGNQPWIFIGRTDAEAEAPIFWPPDEKSQLIGKDPDAGKDWRQEEKGTTEDEMVGWHHWLSGLEFEASAGSWWWTGWPGMLRSMGSQRGGHDLVMEQQQINKCFLWLSNTEYNVLSDKNNYWEHWHDFQDGIKVHDPMVCAFLTSPTSSNQQYCKFLILLFNTDNTEYSVRT